jgi:hypothetical protein
VFAEYGSLADDALGTHLRITFVNAHSLLHSKIFFQLQASISEGEKSAPKVISALNMTHKPPITYSDTYGAAHHIVRTVLSIQHVVLHITYGAEAAPYSKLDQVEYWASWMSSPPSMQYHERLLDTSMRDQDLKETMNTGTGGGDENASLGEEDDGIYREEVKHEHQPTPTQSSEVYARNAFAPAATLTPGIPSSPLEWVSSRRSSFGNRVAASASGAATASTLGNSSRRLDL